eukprot:GHVR01122725.1.p1 GENE.GHVR01122725.1~~GHVR01122725.1.p1  ORF type:complete len:110 (+),score=14.77 GHVR01122725.1:143-472(+)
MADLNETQVRLVNETARPAIEKILAISYYVEALVDELDNQQDALPTDAEVLNDGSGGTSPRTDAPNLTGAQVVALRNVANNMAAQLDGPTRNALIAVAVRDVPTIQQEG